MAVHHSAPIQDDALQLLKDAQSEREQLRNALDLEGQRTHAALEELRSKAAYLENDNVGRARAP